MNTSNNHKASMVLHTANSRGHANHGWLNSYHTFSFSGYYNAERIHFGALRVLNDDTVAPGMGFGTHPHDNMEIISIPLSGDLKHRDTMGNETIIRQGDIQVMSAGRGLSHSEMNANRDREVKFLQIWLFPNRKNVEPRYGQYTINEERMHNNMLQVLSPNAHEEGVWIHQDAWFSMGKLDSGVQLTYDLKKPGNGVYAFVIEGDVTVNGQALNRRDGLGITAVQSLEINAGGAATLLLMEVPMTA
jgi:redox-sensitive bicupin YhaK (pirin superfamily)